MNIFFNLIEFFNFKRYHRSISVSELYKMKDTIEIREQGGAGRMVFLVPGIHAPTPEDNIDVEVSTSYKLCISLKKRGINV